MRGSARTEFNFRASCRSRFQVESRGHYAREPNQETGKQVTLGAPRDQSAEARETASKPLKAQAKHQIPSAPAPTRPRAADTAQIGAWTGDALGPEFASRFARSCEGPLVVALSGGADSVLALELASRSLGAGALLAVHIDHGLRGEESRADADFCRALCAERKIRFRLRHIELSASRSGLEARARQLRYRALCDAALDAGYRTIVTGHHADDALETLLLRWLRGSTMGGLWSPRAESWLHPGSNLYPGPSTAPKLRILRPLLELGRAQIHRWLRQNGLSWREDSSNLDPNWARNRVRHGLLPAIETMSGGKAREALLRFGRAIEAREQDLEQRAHSIQWQLRRGSRPWEFAHPTAECATASLASTAAPPPASIARVGARLERARLLELPATAMLRSLNRLTSAGSGKFPSSAQLDRIRTDLVSNRNSRHTLPKGWQLVLKSNELTLLPPQLVSECKRKDQASGQGVRETWDDGLGKLRLSALNEEACISLGNHPDPELEQQLYLCARLLREDPARPHPTGPDLVELESHSDEVELHVRNARPGDRFFPLGAPGSRKLTRFLADAGIAREERQCLPLVFDGPELIWVAGLRPCHARRLQGRAPYRLQLALRRRPMPT